MQKFCGDAEHWLLLWR